MNWKTGRILEACGFAEIIPEQRERIRDVIGVKLESTPGTYTPPADFDAQIATMLTLPEAPDGYPVLTVSMPCAAYALASAISRDLLMNGEAAYTVHREGDTLFAVDVLDALHAAGIRVEERRDGVTLHLPNHTGSIDGRGLAQLLSPPLRAADLCAVEREVPPARDYLKHDPTKDHRRRREPRHPRIQLRRKR